MLGSHAWSVRAKPNQRNLNSSMAPHINFCFRPHTQKMKLREGVHLKGIVLIHGFREAAKCMPHVCQSFFICMRDVTEILVVINDYHMMEEDIAMMLEPSKAQSEYFIIRFYNFLVSGERGEGRKNMEQSTWRSPF